MADGFDDITQDHREVARLLERYRTEGDEGAAREACQLLALHAHAEEVALYPHLKRLGSGESQQDGVSDGTQLAERAELEHADLGVQVARVLAAPPIDLTDAIGQIAELTAAHVAFEEGELLPKLRPVVDAEELHKSRTAAKDDVRSRAGEPMF